MQSNSEGARLAVFLAAVAWTAAVVFAMVAVGVLAASLRPAMLQDGVSVVLIEAIAFLLVLSAMVRLHHAQVTLTQAFALRFTDFRLLLLAPLVGVCLQGPSQALALFVEGLAPMAPEQAAARAALMVMDTPAKQWLLPIGFGLVVPLVEELMFRGAMFGFVRRHESARGAVVTTAICFTVLHMDPRSYPWIIPPALALGALRAWSGSTWTSLLAHVAFNSFTMFTLLAGWGTLREAYVLPVPLLISSVPLLVLLLFLSWTIARSSDLAEGARVQDEGESLAP